MDVSGCIPRVTSSDKTDGVGKFLLGTSRNLKGVFSSGMTIKLRNIGPENQTEKIVAKIISIANATKDAIKGRCLCHAPRCSPVIGPSAEQLLGKGSRQGERDILELLEHRNRRQRLAELAEAT